MTTTPQAESRPASAGDRPAQVKYGAATGKPYTVTRIGPRAYRVVHHTPAERVVERTYIVRRVGDTVTCSCPAYQFRPGRDRQPCKHGRYLAALLGVTVREAVPF